MTDLAALLDTAFRQHDLAEITIRVSRYGADLKTPEAYQAIAKSRTAMGGPWGVGVTALPSASAGRALTEIIGSVDDGGVFD